MIIIGILGGPPPRGEKVVILLQVHGPHMLCCEILVLLPLTPTGIHVILEEWA